MKKVFLFSIKTIWELIKYIKPLYELIMAIINTIKGDKDAESETKEKKEENHD